MMSSHIPTSEEVFSDISPIIPVIVNSLEIGTQKAKEYFDREKPNDGIIELYTAANITRLWAKEYLTINGQIIEEDNSLNVEKIPNIGLLLRFKNYNIRILKTFNGKLPVPGNSKSRQEFYEQFPLFDSQENDTQPQINLIVLWEVDADYNLTSLSLSYPKKGGTERASVEDNWTQPFPDLLDTIESIVQNHDILDHAEDLQIHKRPKSDAK